MPSHSRPRVLFLTFDVDYINPTRQLIKKAIAEGCDVVLFGPGHSTWEEVESGPFAFEERNGPFDIVVGDEFALIPPPKSAAELPTRSFLNYACRFDRSLIWKGAEYYEFLRQYQGKRVLTLMQSDFYNFPAHMIDRIEQNGDYFMLWGEELVLSRLEADTQSILPGLLNEKVYGRWTDRFLEFVRQNSNRILSTPAVVDLHEFCDTRLVARPSDWSVLGASYDARRVARANLDQNGISRNGKLLHYLMAGSERTPINIFAHYWGIDFFNWAFRKALKRSRYSYTCGSIAKYCIRKFFEIPASGCVLVADPCQGFDELGFVNENTAIACDAKDIHDAHAWLKANPDRAQEIADRGRELTLNQHSVPARARQFDESFQRIHDGTFKGSYWKSGSLAFH